MALSHRRGRDRRFSLILFKLTYRSGTVTDPVAGVGGSMRARASPEQIVIRSSWVSKILGCVDLAKLISWVIELCGRVVLSAGRPETGIPPSFPLAYASQEV